MTEIAVRHPCLDCTLPDCDDGNRGCALRQAIATYFRFMRRREPIPADVRARRNIAFTEIYGAAHNARQKARNKASA